MLQSSQFDGVAFDPFSFQKMAEFPKDKLFVVYCAGPHCNGANRAALRLARLGLPLKMMIGGITGWLDEGFSLATAVAKSGSENA